MTSEHDRLLAEGPREAPEPRAAAGFDLGGQLPEASPSISNAPATRSAVGSRNPARRPFGRLAVPILIAALVGVQALRSHSAGAMAFAAAWAVVLVTAFVRRTRRS
jgi:hypothetical protein